MEDLDLKRWNLAEIRKHLDLVEKQNSRFRGLHKHIVSTFQEQITAEKEEQCMEEFEEVMEDVRDRLEKMALTVKLLLELNDVVKSVRRITGAAVDAHTETQLTECKVSFRRIRAANGGEIDQDERLLQLSDQIGDELNTLTHRVAESMAPTDRGDGPSHDPRVRSHSRSRPYDDDDRYD